MLTTDAGPSRLARFALRPGKLDAPRVVDGVGERDGVPAQSWRAHVDPIGPRAETLAGDDPGLGLDLDRADAELPAQPIGDAARSVAAGLRERAVVVGDEHVGRRSRRPRIARAPSSDRSRAPGRDGWRARPPAPGETAIPACRARGSCCRRRSCASLGALRADGGSPSPQSPFAVRARAAPRWRADLSIARAPSRVTASRKSSSSIDEAAARAAASAASDGAGARRRFSFMGGSGPWRNAIFSTQRQPRCALTRARMIAALCCASSAKAPSTLKHQGRRRDRRLGIALGGARRPFELDGPGVTRDGFADDRGPIGDQARFAQAPRGQDLREERGREFGERLGAAARSASSSARPAERGSVAWTPM